jgi:SPP1 family predicted phage head-tail adaptor
MDKKPFIGSMDRKIQIIKFVKTANSVNEKVTTQEVVASPMAKMEDISGNEDIEGKIRYLVNRKYTIRYNAEVVNLKNELAVKDGEILYDIVNIMEIGRKSHLQIMCKNYE